MGRVVVTEFVSLDGVMEDPGGAEGAGHGAWALEFDRGDDGNKFKGEELWAADAQLLGRVTYEGFAAAWPSRGGDEFSDKFNAMPKYVVSSTLSDEDATWNNSTVLRGDLAQEVGALKEKVGGDMLVAGSRALVHGLAEHGLVDEYRLMVFPVVLGSGKRLFDTGGARQTLRLLEQRAVGPDGVVVMTYATT